MKQFLAIAKARRPTTYDRFGVSTLKSILIAYEQEQYQPHATTSLVWDLG